jgi:hypothetical protein
MKRTVATMVGTTLLALALSACTAPGLSTPAPSAADGTWPRAVDVSVLRDAGVPDHDPAGSLPELAERAPVVISGVVTGWTQGRTLLRAETADRFALLTITVDAAPKSVTAQQQELAFASVYLGAEPVDAEGNPVYVEDTPESVPSVDQLQRAIPTGARMILLGSPMSSDEKPPGTLLLDADAGVAPGEPTVEPWPQGLIFETANGGFDSGIVDVRELAGFSESAAEASGSTATTPSDAGSFDNLVAQLMAIPDQGVAE